jgi:hypothetical protein
VDFVGGVGVPDDKLAILRGGHEMSPIGGPVHGVDFGEMAFEVATGLHAYSRERFGVVLCDLSYYKESV